MASNRRIALAIVAALSFGACSSSGPPDRYSIRYRPDVSVVSFVIDSPVDRVVATLPDVYRHLGLPGGEASNSDEPLVITPALRVNGNLYEGIPNSQYLNCGVGGTGPRADTHALEFVVVTRVVSNRSGRSVIEPLLDGWARDRFGSGTPMPCHGTGKLEAEIAEVLRRMLGLSGQPEAGIAF